MLILPHCRDAFPTPPLEAISKNHTQLSTEFMACVEWQILFSTNCPKAIKMASTSTSVAAEMVHLYFLVSFSVYGDPKSCKIHTPREEGSEGRGGRRGRGEGKRGSGGRGGEGWDRGMAGAGVGLCLNYIAGSHA